MKKLFSPVKAASLFIVVAILAFAGYLAIGRKNGGSIEKNPLVNISELPKEYMEEYFQGYVEIAKTYKKENILIVISKTPLKDTYGAVEVVEAANNQYFLQYETELEKETAFQELNTQGVQVFRNNIYKVSENEEAASGIYNSWGIEAMGLDYASELIDGLEDVPEVTVAVIDTGLDMELMNKYFPGKVDEVYNVLDPEGEMTDEYGHGTHIAGTIAEGTPSNVKILPIKLSSDGFLADTDIITAIDYVTYYEKADVMNMSFSGGGGEFTQPTYLALEAAKEKNIIGVAAAGNESTDADSYPAAFDNTISVSAIDSLGNLADFSNYGDKVTFSAPGVGIKSIMSENATISLDDKNEGKDDNDSDFETIDGTSMATPHVVSAVAILKSLDKNISFDDTIEILSEHVEDFGSSGWDMQHGYGMINFDGVTACNESSIDCDSSNMFEIDVPSEYEISEIVLTPYNYGSLTNILATKVSTTTTNGAIREKMLGDFDIDEIEISGYDPYSTEEQIITIRSSDIETSFSVTNPADWEMGWEYTDSNDGIRLTKYKSHDYRIKTLYFPSVIDSKTVVEIGGNSTCIFGCDEEPNNDSPVYVAAILPSTIIKIDNGLNKLSNLSKVVSYAEELEIGLYSFRELRNLISVDANVLFEDSGSIGAFEGDVSLKEVRLSENNTVIPGQSFSYCSMLTSIEIPANVTSIGPSAFLSSGLSELRGGENLQKVGDYSFSGTNIESFHVSELLTEIGVSAFGSNKSLAEITVSDDNPVYYSPEGSNAIIERDGDRLIVGIKTTVIPNTVKTIAYRSFDTNGLETLEIPEGVVTIEDGAITAFDLWKVVLPYSLEGYSRYSISGDLYCGLWVHRDSYALEKAVEFELTYVIIEEESAPPRDFSSWWSYGTLRAFDTISLDNFIFGLTVYSDGEDGQNMRDIEADSINKVLYGENGELDSLRPADSFTIQIYCDVAGYHNLHLRLRVLVEKAIPDYTAPEIIPATSGQSLSEIELPAGFSWMDEVEVFEGPTETHLVRFTPDDTDNYEIIEDIPVTVTYLDLIEISPSFEIEDVSIDATQTIINDINISVTNLEPEYYIISDLSYQLVWEDDKQYADITFTLELTNKALEHHYCLSDLAIRKQFTIRAEVLVRKSMPDYAAPEIVLATDGQLLSEIELPAGFSWMDETEVFGGPSETHLARFTPDDIYYYEIVENIPVLILSKQSTEIIPSFEVEDVFVDNPQMITSDIITVTNLEPDEYTISNLSYQTAWEDGNRYVDITFTMELTSKALEHYYLEGPATSKQFTERVNGLWTSSDYEGEYDGEYHTITFNRDLSQCTIKYSDDWGATFTLEEIPTYKEIGYYEVIYEISCDGYEPFSSMSMVIIKGVEFTDDILRGQTLRATDADLNILLRKIILIIGPMGGMESVLLTDIDGNTVWTSDWIYNYLGDLATGYRLELRKMDVEANYKIARIGDLTGDGLIDSADLLREQQHLLGDDLLEDEFFIAGDITDDNIINSGDLLRIKQHLIGTKLINEEV